MKNKKIINDNQSKRKVKNFCILVTFGATRKQRVIVQSKCC